MSYVEAVVDSIWFGKQIRSMQSRVRRLYKQVQKAKRREPSLEVEAERCKERLQRLLNYAKRNPVMSPRDQRIANVTLSELERTQQRLRERLPGGKNCLTG